MRRILLGVLLNACAGCSFMFVRPPPDVVSPPEYPVDCTTSALAPAADTLLTIGAVISAGYFATRTNSDVQVTGIILSGTGALVWGFSAGYGSGAVKRCEAVRKDSRLCYAGNEAACRRLDPAWTPAKRMVPAVIPSTPPPTQTGCAKDVDCKGPRICDKGVCVEPPAKPAR